MPYTARFARMMLQATLDGFQREFAGEFTRQKQNANVNKKSVLAHSFQNTASLTDRPGCPSAAFLPLLFIRIGLFGRNYASCRKRLTGLAAFDVFQVFR